MRTVKDATVLLRSAGNPGMAVIGTVEEYEWDDEGNPTAWVYYIVAAHNEAGDSVSQWEDNEVSYGEWRMSDTPYNTVTACTIMMMAWMMPYLRDGYEVSAIGEDRMPRWWQ